MSLQAPLPDIVIALAIAPFFGSFLATVALRWPDWRAIAWRPSSCEACGRRLRPYEMIPLLSWAALRGRCATCHARISLMSPALEIAALVPAAWAATAVSSRPMFWLTCLFGWQLLLLAAIDLRLRRLPDFLTLVLLGSGLAEAILRDAVGDALVGALAGGCVLWGTAWLYRRIRGREGLGEGDGKLAAGLGSWVGLLGLPTVLAIGATVTLAAAVWAQRAKGASASPFAVPLGPGLAFGGWIVWLYGPIGVA